MGLMAAAAVALMFVAGSSQAQLNIRAKVVGNGGASVPAGTTGFRLGGTVGYSPISQVAGGTTTFYQGFWFQYRAVIDVREVPGPVPTSLSLDQNYPNPFNPSTKIEFAIPEGPSQEVRLNVYNSVGTLVTTLVNGTLKEGRYEATFDGAGMSSGVYMYELRVGSQSLMKKMIMSK